MIMKDLVRLTAMILLLALPGASSSSPFRTASTTRSTPRCWAPSTKTPYNPRSMNGPKPFSQEIINSCLNIRGGASSNKNSRDRKFGAPHTRDQDLFDVIAAISRDSLSAISNPNGVVVKSIKKSRAFMNDLVSNEPRNKSKLQQPSNKIGRWFFSRQSSTKSTPAATIEPEIVIRRSSRLLGLGLITWLVAEVLDFFGAFTPMGDSDEDDNVAAAAWKDKLHPIVFNIQEIWTNVRAKARAFWFFHISNAPTRWSDLSLALLQTWPRKYQWACGTMFGMLLAPAAWPVLQVLLEAGGLKLDTVLDEWRLKVNAAISHPDEIVARASHGEFWMPPEKLSVDVQRGVLCGVALGVLLDATREE
ncbi:hypothetical protein MPSEU_001055600 [Mayamaea pseudoterrestris]|nr:hypothetical protein MPSEU_001055600 [Mayamaea pseudoterrestris]